MNIKEVSTRQFAGVKGKTVELENGLNVLVGKNETGKSTMVELIYQTLFRNAELDRRSDKDFIEKFMPSGSNGDVVDGKLIFTTADGVYTLQKKWGKSSFCEIVDEKGNIIEDEKKVKEIIDSELIYKKGLYDDVVFASQKRQANVVEHILNKLDKKAVEKQELVSIIASEGISSTGGIAPEDVARIIADKITELNGHWDFSINAPEKRRGIDNPWLKGNGKILTAYYTMAELEEQLRLTEEAEKAIDVDNTNLLQAQTVLAEANLEKDEYDRYSEALVIYNNGKKLKNKHTEEQRKVAADLEAYPELLNKMGEASALRGLARAEKIISKYNKVKEAKDALVKVQHEIAELVEVTDSDVTLAKEFDKAVANLQAKLSNLDLVAIIKKLGDKDIQVKSVATGKEIDITSGKFDINETVEITVPGIMSMTIAAKGVDAESVKAEMQETQQKLNELLKKYQAKDFDDLEEKKKTYDKISIKVVNAKAAYENVLAGEEYSVIAEEFEKVKDKAEKVDGLQSKIEALCGSETIEAFAGKQEQLVEQIEGEYGKEHTLEAIEERLKNIEIEIKKFDRVEKDAENIPERFLEIEDVDKYKAELKKKISQASEKIEEAKKSLTKHEKSLGDKNPDDLRASIEDARIEFTKLKDECLRWQHIMAVLNKTKDNMAGESTMADVQEKFTEYLSAITDGKVALTSMDENMNVNIFSGENPLKYDILSEGTKDTIALAFRLAMLEHLFPNGGGLVVLDDPFTDMDEDRTKQACKLVQQFADKGNQVLFVTCDNKYRTLLKGNVINM
ncbi:AAA domain-containing protein [Lachnospiraceae bacterium XBB1006]|nr:AAA domain-containing protein [Lachnospiraceae bacterium XBB1006]